MAMWVLWIWTKNFSKKYIFFVGSLDRHGPILYTDFYGAMMQVLGGQKNAKFVSKSSYNGGTKSQKIQNVGSHPQKKLKNTKLWSPWKNENLTQKRQRVTFTLQWWPKIKDFPKNIQNQSIMLVKKVQNL